MDVLRCKTPELLRKETWAHVLAGNLIRTIIAQAASQHGREPRSISFKGAIQTLEAFQSVSALQGQDDSAFRSHLYQQILDGIDEYHAGHSASPPPLFRPLSPEAEARGARGDPPEVQRCRLLEIFVKVCETVAYAHNRGVIHRDLKPDNVMIGPYGETLVLDWGMAKVLNLPEQPGSAPVHLTYTSGSSKTQAGHIMGSPFYMAPEMADGRAVDADERTDVYLLGATLYHILTGHAPREGRSLEEVIELARNAAPPPPRKLKGDVPRALEAICLKAMAHGKQDRYAGALELADDMQRYLAGAPVTAYPEPVWARAWRWCKRHRRALARSLALAPNGRGRLLCNQSNATVCVPCFRGPQGQRLGETSAGRESMPPPLRVILHTKAPNYRLLLVALLGMAVLGTVLVHVTLEREAARRRAAEERQEALQREAENLRLREQIRRNLAEFHRLAQERQFYAGGTIPGTDRPLPVDPRKSQDAGEKALALADRLAAEFKQLSLPDEQATFHKQLHDLLLLMVQAQSRQSPGPETVRILLQRLERAAPLQKPSRGYYRLRARCYQLLGDTKQQNEEARRADDPALPATALDHFLQAEQLRAEADSPAARHDDATLPRPNAEHLIKAIEHYHAALRIEPAHYWSHLHRGRCAMSLDKKVEAVEAFGTCVALQPDLPWGYSSRGLALGQLGRYAEGEADLNRALALERDFRPALLHRGLLAWMQGKTDRALADFAKVVEPPAAKRLIEAAYYRGRHLHFSAS